MSCGRSQVEDTCARVQVSQTTGQKKNVEAKWYKWTYTVDGMPIVSEIRPYLPADQHISASTTPIPTWLKLEAVRTILNHE
jgi:hypothetical protein